MNDGTFVTTEILVHLLFLFIFNKALISGLGSIAKRIKSTHSSYLLTIHCSLKVEIPGK